MGTTRSIEQLIQDFKEAAGEFEKFHNEMNEEERTMFKNWLDEKRKTPGVKAYYEVQPTPNLSEIFVWIFTIIYIDGIKTKP